MGFLQLRSMRSWWVDCGAGERWGGNGNGNGSGMPSCANSGGGGVKNNLATMSSIQVHTSKNFSVRGVINTRVLASIPLLFSALIFKSFFSNQTIEFFSSFFLKFIIIIIFIRIGLS